MLKAVIDLGNFSTHFFPLRITSISLAFEKINHQKYLKQESRLDLTILEPERVVDD
jgi:hypothetical protein